MKGWHKEKRFGNYDHVTRMQVKQAMEREARMFEQITNSFEKFFSGGDSISALEKIFDHIDHKRD